jgi:outer membrane protein assembly factor BamB
MRRGVLAVVVPLVCSTMWAGGAHAAPACAPASGGDWPSYGGNLSNARNQAAETGIDAANAGSLHGTWSLSSVAAGGIGSFQSTPIVADGCMLAATTSGSIFAVNADTGELVWNTLEASGGGLLGGIFAPAVVNGVVYATVGRSGAPYAVALDEATGAELWKIDLYQGLFEGETHLQNVNSSVVVFDGLVFVALAGADSFVFSHPSFFILDASDGSILKKTTVIPQEAWFEGYAGGGMWATGVVDTATKYLYVGTANPYNKRREHAHTNSIVKIDLDRSRYTTFGQIVGFYKGDLDYDPALYNTPQCVYLGELQPVGFSTFCGQKDVDFGASPSLFTNAEGRTIVVNLQKSCTVHAVYADTMQLAWKRPELGPGGASGCASTTAYDDHAIYVNINGSHVFALDKDTGATLWDAAYNDAGTHYQPMTVANGVAYTVGNNGHLFAFDAKTGAVVLDQQLADPSGIVCGSAAGAGVSVAQNTVYAACDSATGGPLGPLAALPTYGLVSLSGGAVFAYRL